MFSITPEGHILRVGLNLTFGTWRKPYVTFRWVWYNTLTRKLTSWRFRIRLYQWPAFMWSKSSGDPVKSWLFDNDMVPVYRSLLEDEAPRILAVMRVYESCDYPSSDAVITFRDGKAVVSS